MNIRLLSVFLFLFATFQDFESRWHLFCEYTFHPEKLQERFDLETRMSNAETY